MSGLIYLMRTSIREGLTGISRVWTQGRKAPLNNGVCSATLMP